MLTKPGIRRPVMIPGEVPVTQILTNMRTAGMSRDTYFRLLNDVNLAPTSQFHITSRLRIRCRLAQRGARDAL